MHDTKAPFLVDVQGRGFFALQVVIRTSVRYTEEVGQSTVLMAWFDIRRAVPFLITRHLKSGCLFYIYRGVHMNNTQDIRDEIVTFNDGTTMRMGSMTVEDHQRKIDEMEEELEETENLISVIKAIHPELN